MAYLSIVALIPLAAVVLKSLENGPDSFWTAISSPQAVAALKLTLIASVVVVLINAVFGTLIAWVLVRDDFPGKSIVNSLIDLPFALPTIVAGLTLLALYGPDSPVGINVAFTRAAVVMALLFVTLPFVVRAVQPVLLELDREMEQAAESLGASRTTVFRRIILPNLTPAIIAGAGPGVRARGGRVRLARPDHGQPPVQDGGRVRISSSPGSRATTRSAPPRCPSCCSSWPWWSCCSSAGSRRGRCAMKSKYALRFIALGYLALLLGVPVVLVFVNAFQDGIGAAWDAVTTPEAQHAFWLTMVMVAVAVPLNTIFGILAALAIVRQRFRGRALLNALVDLPFAVSPVVVGLALLLVYGRRDGWVGPWFADHGVQIIFSTPGMILATIFVSLPFVVREVIPVLREIGTEQEQAAATLGAGPLQTFFRVTLPAIRWGVAYGVVLTTARALGEFGAVSVVSGKLSGQTETATLFVENRFQRFDETGAYAASVVLALLALVTLLAMNLIKPKEAQG